MKRNIIYFSFLVAIFFAACSKSDPAPVVTNIVNFSSTINGASETPTNSSTATGSAALVYNKDTKILTLSMTYTGLTATNMHIHKGPAGTPGGVLFGLGVAPFSSPVNFASQALTVGQEDSLLSNLYYLNIHSAAFPGGEIRGQIMKQ
jgi:hypothetical protein